MKKTYYPTLREIADNLGVPYNSLYKLKHRPEFQKSERGYNLKKIANCLEELERIREEEEKEKSLLGAEEELLEKQIKLETARHKCRLLELQIAQKEGNLVDVNYIIETRTKEITRLKKHFTEMLNHFPNELKNSNEMTIKNKLSNKINEILADLAEFIIDNWEEEEQLNTEEE